MDEYKLITADGQEMILRILFIFKLNGIDYIVYADKENDILASRFDKEEGKIKLNNIETDFEWELVDNEIAKRLGE